MNNRISKPMEMSQITLQDQFWNEKMELVRTKVLPYQEKAKCEYGFVIKTGKQEKIRYNRQ